MKNFIISALLLAIVQNATSQVKVPDDNESELKGHVKTVVEYIFRGDIDLENIDTSAYAGKATRIFDINGHQLYELIVFIKGQSADSVSYTYMGDSVIVGNQYHDGKLFVKNIYKYDKDGKKTEFDISSNYDPKMFMDGKTVYKYNEVGEMITEETTGKKLTRRVTYEYNAIHQKIKGESTNYFDSRTTIENTWYSYESNGNKITAKVYNASGKLTDERNVLHSNFDREGNWLLGVFESKGNIQQPGTYSNQSITKKVIEYY